MKTYKLYVFVFGFVAAMVYLGLSASYIPLTSMSCNSESGMITRAAATASSDQVIICGFKPKILFFTASDSADASNNSDGRDNGQIAACQRSSSLVILSIATSLTTTNKVRSIDVESILADGHTAYVSATTDTSFTLTWTKLGAGKLVTARYIIIR